MSVKKPADADSSALSACPFVHRTTGNVHIDLNARGSLKSRLTDFR